MTYFNKVVHLRNLETQVTNLGSKDSNAPRVEPFTYEISGDFIDKVSFYDISKFNKKNNSLIQLY